MKIFKLKKPNRTALLMTAAAILLIVIVLITVFAASANYQKIYSTPRVSDAVMDFMSYDAKDSPVDSVMSGEWEFFYNRWIISDNENDAIPDALINLPKRWTNKKINGQRISKKGYASYRLTVLNIKPDLPIYVHMNNSAVAYRIYINGNLTTSSGTVSKNPKETLPTGKIDLKNRHIVRENEILTVVIEVSACSNGGILNSPWLSFNTTGSFIGNFITKITLIMLGITLSFVLFSLIMNFGLFRKEKQFTSSLLLLFILFHFLTTKEMGLQYSSLGGYNHLILFNMRFITGIALLAVFLLHIISTKLICLNKPAAAVISVSGILSILAYFLSEGTSGQIFSIIVPLMTLWYIVYLLAVKITKRQKFSILYFFMLTLFIGILTLEAIDTLGLVVYGMESFFSVILIVLMLIFSIVNFIKIKDNTDKALQAVKLENEIFTVKQETLKAQIKPHFVFNSLTAIQALYKKNISDGDAAIVRFAHHLRLNVNAHNKNTIPFREELLNILNYFELENLRLEDKLTLLLDIDYENFNVPVLSLQPLVENAIKYAETDKIEDGYIQIITERNEKNIILTVKDNGKGFDTTKIKENSHGLKNISERLRFLLGANISVVSAINAGTTVTIEIPQTEENKL